MSEEKVLKWEIVDRTILVCYETPYVLLSSGRLEKMTAHIPFLLSLQSQGKIALLTGNVILLKDPSCLPRVIQAFTLLGINYTIVEFILERGVTSPHEEGGNHNVTTTIEVTDCEQALN